MVKLHGKNEFCIDGDATRTCWTIEQTRKTPTTLLLSQRMRRRVINTGETRIFLVFSTPPFSTHRYHYILRLLHKYQSGGNGNG